MDKRFLEGLFRLADPKISITSVASMIVGGAVAARDAEIAWGWHVAVLFALFCFEVAKNASGDVIDYDSGTDLAVAPEDRTAFSGGKRVLVDQLLTRGQTWGIAIGFGLCGALAGLAIALYREPAVLWVGLAGIVLGWSYHGPPLRLSYRGFGELDVMICFGPLIALGTYLVQVHAVHADVVWLSFPLGIFIAAFLWANEFPDHDADSGAGKRNLIVRLGRLRASRALPAVYAAGWIVLAVAPFLSSVPFTACLGFVALPTAVAACIWIWRDPETFHRSSSAQAAALITFVLYAVGAGGGVLLAR